MDQHTLHHLDKEKVCELCFRHDPMVKDYKEDRELQTALQDYVSRTTGDQVNVQDIARLCDSCYTRVSDTQPEKSDLEG